MRLSQPHAMPKWKEKLMGKGRTCKVLPKGNFGVLPQSNEVLPSRSMVICPAYMVFHRLAHDSTARRLPSIRPPSPPPSFSTPTDKTLFKKDILTPATTLHSPTTVSTMCIQLIELYALCRCPYHKHAIDPCLSYGRRGHQVMIRELLVGYGCPNHSTNGSPSAIYRYHPDSGYASDHLGNKN